MIGQVFLILVSIVGIPAFAYLFFLLTRWEIRSRKAKQKWAIDWAREYGKNQTLREIRLIEEFYRECDGD